MSRKSRVIGSFLGLVIAGSFLATRPNAQTEQDLRAAENLPKQQTLADRERQWLAFRRDAGKPNRGLVCEVRTPGAALAVGDVVDLEVLVKNISSKPVQFEEAQRESPALQGLPIALVRGPNGEFLPLSREGARRLRPPPLVIANSFEPPEIEPGRAIRFKFPLSKFYPLTTPGTYTVMLAMERQILVGAERVSDGRAASATPVWALRFSREFLVAKVLQLELRAPRAKPSESTP